MIKKKSISQEREDEVFELFGMTSTERSAENMGIYYADEIKLCEEGKSHMVNKITLGYLYQYKLISPPRNKPGPKRAQSR